jgi:hypothetical protein
LYAQGLRALIHFYEGRRVSLAGKQHEAGNNPEYGDGMFIRNVGYFHRTTRRFIPEHREFFTVNAMRTSDQTVGLDGILYLLSGDNIVTRLISVLH